MDQGKFDTHAHRRTHLGRRGAAQVLALMAAGALALGAAGCAPEPGQEAGSIDKETQTISPETEWGGQDVPEEDLQTALPESFPHDAFAMPEGATIYNAGEKSADAWFVVLSADSAAAAQTQWDAIISESSFEVVDPVETTEGGISATLRSVMLTVQAVTIPQDDGSVLLSYDIQRFAQ